MVNRMKPLLLLASALLLGACARRPAATAMPVTWFSIPADDVAKATGFYRDAFGWKVEPLTREANAVYDYNVVVNAESDSAYVARERGRVNGCIIKRATGITAPAMLVEVPDLDAAARKIVAAGGTIVSDKVPMRSLGGAFLLAKDPDGNVLEVFQPGAR